MFGAMNIKQDENVIAAGTGRRTPGWLLTQRYNWHAIHEELRA
jgi:hypothetical protein